MQEQDDIVNSLAHTKWNCKYHIVFAPKYRRKVFFEEKRLEIREILGKLCQWKGAEIMERGVSRSYTHVCKHPAQNELMGYLKGKRSLMIFQKET